jgi:hypothetical protein
MMRYYRVDLPVINKCVVEFYIKADNGDAAIATAKQMWVDHGRKFIENDTDKTIPHYLGEGTSGFGEMQQWFDFDTLS